MNIYIKKFVFYIQCPKCGLRIEGKQIVTAVYEFPCFKCQTRYIYDRVSRIFYGSQIDLVGEEKII